MLRWLLPVLAVFGALIALPSPASAAKDAIPDTCRKFQLTKHGNVHAVRGTMSCTRAKRVLRDVGRLRPKGCLTASSGDSVTRFTRRCFRRGLHCRKVEEFNVTRFEGICSEHRRLRKGDAFVKFVLTRALGEYA